MFQQLAGRANTRNEWHGNMARYAAGAGLKGDRWMSDVGVGLAEWRGGGVEGSRVGRGERGGLDEGNQERGLPQIGQDAL